MNKCLGTAIAAVALFAWAEIGNAGTLTLDPNQPVYNPTNEFSNSTITATSQGSIINVVGDTNVTGAPGDMPKVSISGTFTLEAGETFSYAYQVSVDLNSTVPVTMTIGGSAMITSPFMFNPTPIMDSHTLMQGPHTYSGNGSITNPFGVQISGTFQGSVTFAFAASAAADSIQPQAPGTNMLHLTIPNNGLLFGAQPQPVQVPEPSTYALLITALGGLGLAVTRRKLLA